MFYEDLKGIYLKFNKIVIFSSYSKKSCFSTSAFNTQPFTIKGKRKDHMNM